MLAMPTKNMRAAVATVLAAPAVAAVAVVGPSSSTLTFTPHAAAQQPALDGGDDGTNPYTWDP